MGGPSHSATVEVWDIIDGDTIKVQPHGRIRLDETETPELRQPYVPVARRALAKKIQVKTVRLYVYDAER